MNKLQKMGGVKFPAFFDLGLYLFTFLTPIFFLPHWRLNMVRSFAFVLGVFFLLGLSFLSKRKREFNSPILGIIVLWSLFSIFLHNFKIYGNSVYAKFIAFSTMSEGFIYVLCGVLLYYLVISYADKFDIFYPLLAINILNLFFATTQALGIKLIWSYIPSICGLMGISSQLCVFSAMSIPILGRKNIVFGVIPLITLFMAKSNTGLLAFYFISLIYFLKQNWLNESYRKIIIWGWIILGCLFIFWKYPALLVRLSIRLETWLLTLKEIIKSPFLGYGFDKTIANNMVWSVRDTGWVYRQNDYLNIAKDLGIPFLVFVLYLIRDTLKNTRFNYLTVSIGILLIACFFQTNMYFSWIASTGIIILALKKIEKLDAQNQTR